MANFTVHNVRNTVAAAFGTPLFRTGPNPSEFCFFHQQSGGDGWLAGLSVGYPAR